MVRRLWPILGVAVAVVLLGSDRARCQEGKVPWQEPQDTTAAINEPDKYAWRLFVALNWPASSSACAADETKKLGDSGITVWERWPSKQEVYLDGAEQPPPWSMICGPQLLAQREEKSFQQSGEVKVALQQMQKEFTGGGAMEVAFIPPGGAFSTAEDEEVRMNRDTYEFVRTERLYDLRTQEELAAEGVETLVFPLNAKEVKAHWVKLEDDQDPSRYHTASFEGDTYGLVGLHIVTRDMPRWFWSTFEHVDNDEFWPARYPKAFRGWIVPSVDTLACPPPKPADCNEFPSGMGLEGTKWQYYRLRGTQTDWVDHRGEPTILPNSKVEGGFDQHSMSCITRHALAVKGDRGEPMPIRIIPGQLNDEGRPKGYIGPLPPELFRSDRNFPVKYLGLDFVWSLRNAKRGTK